MSLAAVPPLDPELLALQEVCRGRFALERELGRGGMGIVVLARDLALDRPVALKLLPAVLARQPLLRERFLREARTAAGLAHPNVVPIHAVEAHGDVVFFVMGYVEGETLARRLERTGPLAPAEATRVLRDVAWALAYAHGRGVVHRDVKPDNILLDRGSGRALVTDFGIARVADAATALTAEGLVMGTAQFMSPEQASGEPVDGRSDLYALGVVGHLALTGRPPFEAPSVPALLALQVMHDAPPIATRRPELPSALATAVDRCLARSPEDRFPTAEALADALDDAGPRTPEIAPQLRNFIRMAEQSTMQLMVMLPLLLAATVPGSKGTARALAPLLALLAATFGVGVDLGRRARQLLMDGFTAGDALRGFLLEDDLRAQEIAAVYHGRHEARLARLRRRALTVAGVTFLAGVGLGRATKELPRDTTERILGTGVAIALILVAALAWVVGINTSARAERSGARLSSRLWRGIFTIWFFQLAGIGLDRSARPASAPGARSHASGDPESLDVPEPVQARHPELRALLRATSVALDALGDRAARIERVLAESGGARPALDAGADGAGATTRGALVSRQLGLVADLRLSLDEARARRSDVLIARENVRIQLARARAGLADAEALDADVAALRALLAATTDAGPRASVEPRLAAASGDGHASRPLTPV